jgi:hypothetical protein
MNSVCNKCGRAPAGVTHICPPLEGSFTVAPTMVSSPIVSGYTDPRDLRIADLEKRIYELEQLVARLSK